MAQLLLLQSEPQRPSSFGRLMPHRVGRYVLVEPLSHGDFNEGDVARSPDGSVVVIKAAAVDTPASDEGAAAERSLELLAANNHHLVHPNIAGVVGFGRQDAPDGGRHTYVATEHVPAIDLCQLLLNCARRKIVMPAEVGLTIACAVLRALDHVHRARDEAAELLGIVHGDVSAAKVIIGFDGRTRLCDFAIAGSSAPSDEPVDKAADLQAVGLLMWELLFGRAGAAHHSQPAMLLVRGLPHERRLHAIVHRALAAAPGDRYRVAAHMLRDLETYIDDVGLEPSEPAVAAWLDTHFGVEKRWQDERLARVSAAEVRATDDMPAVDHVEEPPASGVRRIARPPALTADPPLQAPATIPAASSTAAVRSPLPVLLVAGFAASFIGTTAALCIRSLLELL